MVLVIIINKNLRRKTRSENPAQCYESSSDGFIVLAQSVLYHSFLYGAGTGLLDCMFVNQTPYIRPLETPRGCPAALRYHPRTPPDTPPQTHPPARRNLGGCHTKTGGVLTPPRGGVHNSLPVASKDCEIEM